ncbi:autophagocytosis associated protein [Thraustotheca clavata]|uniref:Autophagocytosis associated protein n=1 Tax=Thraustotheca clavata TaxID=74557 RepID=A0A1W0AC23_9STRA|nr:autophagocytosis associated protein [Thraustotheca clavata]
MEEHASNVEAKVVEDSDVGSGCAACGLNNNEESILLCDGDGCTAEYHIYCLSPPLQSVPDGDFYCPVCSGKDSYEVRGHKDDGNNEPPTYSEEQIYLEPVSNLRGVFRRYYEASNGDKTRIRYKPFTAIVPGDNSTNLGVFHSEVLAGEAYDTYLVQRNHLISPLDLNYPTKITKYQSLSASNDEAEPPARTRRPKVEANEKISSRTRKRGGDEEAAISKRRKIDVLTVRTGDIPTNYIGVLVFADFSVAQIKILETVVHIGVFDTPEEAAAAYDREAIRHYCRGTPLNFPERRAALEAQIENAIIKQEPTIHTPENRYNKNIERLLKWTKTVHQTVKLIEASRRVEWPQLDVDGIENGPIINEQFTVKDKKIRRSCAALSASVDSIIQESKYYQEKSPSGMFLNPPPGGCFLELVAPAAFMNYCEKINEFSKADFEDPKELDEALMVVLDARKGFLKKKVSEDSMIQELEQFMTTAVTKFAKCTWPKGHNSHFVNYRFVQTETLKYEDGSIDKGECCLAMEVEENVFELYPLETLQRKMITKDDVEVPVQWTLAQAEAHEIDELVAYTQGLDISSSSVCDIVPWLKNTFNHEFDIRRRVKSTLETKLKRLEKLRSVESRYDNFMESWEQIVESHDAEVKNHRSMRESAEIDGVFLRSLGAVILPGIGDVLEKCIGHIRQHMQSLSERLDTFSMEYEYYTSALEQLLGVDEVDLIADSYIRFFTRELHRLWKEKHASIETLYLLLRSVTKAVDVNPPTSEVQQLTALIEKDIARWEVFTWPPTLLDQTKSYLHSTRESNDIPMKVKTEPTETVGELKILMEATIDKKELQLKSSDAGKKSSKPTTLVIYHPVCIKHETPREHPECPARLTHVVATLGDLSKRHMKVLKVERLDGTAEELSPSESALLLVHSPAYLEQLKSRSEEATDEALVFETDPGDDNDGAVQRAPDVIRPFALSGGAFRASALERSSVMDTYVSANSWDVARIAAGTVCIAVDKVLNGEFKNAVCLVRPPGHHVGRNGRTPSAPSSGFCLLNNVVIGALHARMHPSVVRVAVLDWDIHHGNGTEELMRGDPRSFFSSIHLYVNHFFPGTGPTANDGNIINVGLTDSGLGSGSEAFRSALTDQVFPAMIAFKPDIIFISAGFDGHKDDILGGMAAVGKNSTAPAGYVEEDYAWATKEILEIADSCCQGRVISVLEGGYDVRHETNSLAKSVSAHIHAICEGYNQPIPSPSTEEETKGELSSIKTEMTSKEIKRMNLFHNVREYLTPVLAESGFVSDGVLTPDEFVAAGDQLCYKCPTWRWEAGDAASRKAYLPPNKQFLRTTGVPCRRRVTSLEQDYAAETPLVDEEDGEWMATHNNNVALNEVDQTERLQNISLENEEETPSINILSSLVDEHFQLKGDEVVPDLHSFEDSDNLVEEDEAALTYVAATEPDPLEHDAEGNLVYTRTYDLSITYDKYYRTPRVWLFGYEESGAPLKPEDMLQDIMQDYANKTVTLEPHPHQPGIPHAAIHPCQHGAVMKRIVANLMAGGKEIRSDQYMFIFLKFLQSVIPTIDYDYTMEVEAKS